jgi:hypothetical protein
VRTGTLTGTATSEAGSLLQYFKETAELKSNGRRLNYEIEGK